MEMNSKLMEIWCQKTGIIKLHSPQNVPFQRGDFQVQNGGVAIFGGTKLDAIGDFEGFPL